MCADCNYLQCARSGVTRSKSINRKAIMSLVLLACLLIPLESMAQGIPLGARVLREGVSGSDVLELQEMLKSLGFDVGGIDGVFGRQTREAVLKFQEQHGLASDGIVGNTTLEALKALVLPASYVVREGDSLWKLARNFGTTVGEIARANDITNPHQIEVGQRLVIPRGTVSRGGRESSLLVHWDQARRVFSVGSVATVTDVKTGLSFQLVRTGGTLHADSEPRTSRDTTVLKRIYGGAWSWDRRAVIVEVKGRKMAASINGMPHGHDTITNNFPGHICVHFLGSRLHVNGELDPEHQRMVMMSALYGSQ